jgi:hypothetical protein
VENESEYVYDLFISDKNDGKRFAIENSNMCIKKYYESRQYDLRRPHEKFKHVKSGIEPMYDSTSMASQYRYKFTGDGKYQICIKIAEISGESLMKDIYIIFDQQITRKINGVVG